MGNPQLRILHVVPAPHGVNIPYFAAGRN